MPSSWTEHAGGPALTLSVRGTDRAGWARLVVAVLIGLVAAVGPVLDSTSAQFTGTDQVTLSVRTADDFGGGPAPQEASAQPGSAFLTPTRPHWVPHPHRPRTR